MRPLRLLLSDAARVTLAGLTPQRPAALPPGNAFAQYLRAVLEHQASLLSLERSRHASKAGPGRMHGGGKARPTGSKLWRKCPSAFETDADPKVDAFLREVGLP